MTDSELSAYLGVAHNTVWRWRNKIAEPSEFNGMMLARLAGISMSELRYMPLTFVVAPKKC